MMESGDRSLTGALEQSRSNNFPDFSHLGYQIEQELGHNRGGGRVTYLAVDTKAQQFVVLKQFQFARIGISWSDYEAYERELELLQRLNHPSIPKYLAAFETTDGFCVVQEYKQAPCLAQPRSFTLEEIKQIAVGVLEVLVYLQQQIPPVIHRDIKPENLLVDEHKVYLVDFGLARVGEEEIAASSAVKGTLGFMPPEQLFNRQLTKASDLYSLGATLICLLTKTKSTEIGNLVDEAYRINFKSSLPKLNPQFTDWLQKLTAPNPKHRYPDAATALNALQSIDFFIPVATPTRFMPIITRVLLLNLGLASVLGASFVISHRMAEPTRIANPPNNRDAIMQLKNTRQCSRCDLRGANLRGADLKSVDLTAADLTDADLTGADLRGAYLAKANLTNARLLHPNLASTDLRGATMPDGSTHP